MSVDLPVSIWRPTNGSGEAGQSNDEEITTLSGLGIVTLSGEQLIVAPGTLIKLPATEWEEDDSE